MDIANKLDEIVEEAVNSIVPGLAIEVNKDGAIVYERTAGYRTTSPSLAPVTVETRFDLASLTKIVTSTIIFILCSRSRLSLSTKVASLLMPQLSIRLRERFSRINIQELLTHTSGLPAWHPFYCNREPLFTQIEELIPTFSQDRKVCYSDLNFILLGKIIEQITGLSLQDAFRELIKEPLGLKSMDYGPVSDVDVAATEFGNRIEMKMCEERKVSFSGWRKLDEPINGEVNDGNAHYYFHGVSGHAGLFSTVKDVSRFAQTYTVPTFAERIDLDWESIKASCRELAPGRGLGWEVSPVFINRAGHTGFTGTSICVDPDERIVVTLLTNRLHQEQPSNLTSLRQNIHENIFRLIHNA